MTAPHLLAAQNRRELKPNKLPTALLIEMLLLAIIASQTSSVKIKNVEVA